MFLLSCLMHLYLFLSGFFFFLSHRHSGTSEHTPISRNHQGQRSLPRHDHLAFSLPHTSPDPPPGCVSALCEGVAWLAELAPGWSACERFDGDCAISERSGEHTALAHHLQHAGGFSPAGDPYTTQHKTRGAQNPWGKPLLRREVGEGGAEHGSWVGVAVPGV